MQISLPSFYFQQCGAQLLHFRKDKRKKSGFFCELCRILKSRQKVQLTAVDRNTGFTWQYGKNGYHLDLGHFM